MSCESRLSNGGDYTIRCSAPISIFSSALPCVCSCHAIHTCVFFLCPRYFFRRAINIRPYLTGFDRSLQGTYQRHLSSTYLAPPDTHAPHSHVKVLTSFDQIQWSISHVCLHSLRHLNHIESSPIHTVHYSTTSCWSYIVVTVHLLVRQLPRLITEKRSTHHKQPSQMSTVHNF